MFDLESTVVVYRRKIPQFVSLNPNFYMCNYGILHRDIRDKWFTHLMWLWHRHTFLHQKLDNFIVVGVCSKNDGSDVRGEVRELLVQ